MTIEQIIERIDQIDAVIEQNRKDMSIMYQERKGLYDKLVSLNRKHDATSNHS